MTIPELLALHAKATTERERAVIERRMWASVSRDVRQANRRDKWLQSVIGGETGYVFIKRAELLNGEPDTELLWPRIDAKTMTTSKAIEILRQARATNIAEEIPLKDAIIQQLAEYDNLPHTVELDNGYTIKKPSPVFEKVHRGRRKAKTPQGQKQNDSKEFYSKLQQDCTEFFVTRLGMTLDVFAQERLKAEFILDLKTLIDEWRSKLNNVHRRAGQDILAEPERKDLLKACRVLSMEPPKPGEPIDMVTAKKNKKKLARVYHPDKVGNDSTTDKYQEVIEAYNVLEQIAERTNNGA